MKKVENLLEMGEIIRQRRRERGLTLDQVAGITGISKPYLSNIETARIPGPASDEKLRRLEEALGFPAGELVELAAWLRTPESVRALFKGEVKRRGDGAVDLDALLGGESGKGKGERERTEGKSMEVEDVELINRVAAGEAVEYTDLDYPVGVADTYLPLPTGAEEVGEEVVEEGGKRETKRAKIFATRVEGESMLPEYRPGDIVVVSSREPVEGEDCLVRLGAAENFATTLKRIYFEPAEGRAEALRLVPRNGKFAQRVVGLEQVTGIYPVVWKVMRVGKGE